MKSTRRNFLKRSGTVALAAALTGPFANAFGQNRNAVNHLASARLAASTDPISYLTQKDFISYIGEVFELRRDGQRPVKVRLIEAAELHSAFNEKRGYVGESFSLLFEGMGKSRLTGDLYDFDHYALGKFSLLVTPIGMSGTQYEAVVNRIALQG
ncbi:MAG: twin-arginine translocation signal domain-containing protein [Acidobacteriota bacterium]